ncbi:MAG: hypothetical protein ACTHN7_11535 [Solirubrobacterales bacterium]
MAATFGLVAGSSAVAGAVTTELGNIQAHFDASVSPQALAKTKQTPLALQAAMGSKRSTARICRLCTQFEIGVDRHARLNLKDVPVCRPGNVDEMPIRQRCKKALIGTGKMVTDIHFPELTVPPIPSEVTVYNAGVRNGIRNLLAGSYLTLLTPSEIVITIAVEHDHGGFGAVERPCTPLP